MVLFRVYINEIAYPNNSTVQIIVGDIGSTVLSLTQIIVMDIV